MDNIELKVKYDHSSNRHGVLGPDVVFKLLKSKFQIKSVLDVGTGTGTWLKAAVDNGVSDVIGVDGIPIEGREFHVNPNLFSRVDLTNPFFLNRRFDVVLCLEVAEHLPEAAAGMLIRSIVQHSDLIIFSAAVPGQRGDHHINCQWPTYWQDIFNQSGFACYDDLRSDLWYDTRVEAWYRQNIFVAKKSSTSSGKEDRIQNIIHPDMIPAIHFAGVYRPRMIASAIKGALGRKFS